MASALVELKFRTNPKPVITSADEILGAGGPGGPEGAFQQMIKDAEGGTLVIDEAYRYCFPLNYSIQNIII